MITSRRGDLVFNSNEIVPGFEMGSPSFRAEEYPLRNRLLRIGRPISRPIPPFSPWGFLRSSEETSKGQGGEIGLGSRWRMKRKWPQPMTGASLQSEAEVVGFIRSAFAVGR
jgi:hypothetical protein